MSGKGAAVRATLLSPVRWVGRAATAPAGWVDRLLPNGKSRLLAVRAMAVTAAVLLVAVGVLSLLAVRDARVNAARVQGMAAAIELTPRLLTYDFRSMADDRARAQAAVTGDFAGQYSEFADQFLAPNVAAQNFLTKATVRNTAQVSATSDQLVALIWMDQFTSSKALTAPRLDNVGVRVTLTEVDGRWLISQLDRL